MPSTARYPECNVCFCALLCEVDCLLHMRVSDLCSLRAKSLVPGFCEFLKMETYSHAGRREVTAAEHRYAAPQVC